MSVDVRVPSDELFRLIAFSELTVPPVGLEGINMSPPASGPEVEATFNGDYAEEALVTALRADGFTVLASRTRADDGQGPGLFERLAALGLNVRVVGPGVVSWVEVHGRDCWLAIEARPSYCDRGRWIVKGPWLNDGKTEADLTVDAHDGFPRYYFGAEACASEVYEWMRARSQL